MNGVRLSRSRSNISSRDKLNQHSSQSLPGRPIAYRAKDSKIAYNTIKARAETMPKRASATAQD
jgi:hypothetical protein